jgi:hypothetical protein
MPKKEHMRTVRSLKKKGWVKGYMIKTASNEFYRQYHDLETAFFAFSEADCYKIPYARIKPEFDRIVKVRVNYRDVLKIEEL